MQIFNNGDYEFISDLIEQKLPILKSDTEFNKKYIRLTDAMEELENELTEIQKQKFNEIVKLFYETEKYYFSLSYSLGIKYGNDLKQL